GACPAVRRRRLPAAAPRLRSQPVRHRASGPGLSRSRGRTLRGGAEIPSYDVLIVGGGAAGIRAAIAAAQTDPRLRMAMVSNGDRMRSHTVSAEGGAAAVLRDEDSLDGHAFDTIKGSDYLADQDVVEAFVNEAPEEINLLERWGCPWSREP